MFPPIACIVLISALLPSLANGSSQNNGLEKHERRQISPTANMVVPLSADPSSPYSFDYWWPFPPATTSVGPVETESPGANEDLPMISVTTSAMLSSATAIGSTSALSQDGGTASSPLITITALPPLSSPWHHPHPISAYKPPASPMGFIPLVVISCLGSGFLCGWYGFGYWRRRRQDARPGAIVAGPKYEGIKYQDADDQGKFLEKDSGGNSDKTYDEEQFSQHPHSYKDVNEEFEDTAMMNQAVIHKTGSTWSRVGSSVFQRTPLLSGLLNHIRPNGNNENKAEEQRSGELQSPCAPTVFSSVASLDEDDEDYEDARRFTDEQGTVRYKSVRSRLSEKLHQFSPGYGFGGKKSKVRIKARGKTPELEEGVLLQDDPLTVDSPSTPGKWSLRRSKKRPTGHGRALSDFSVLLDDVQTPPKAYALKDPGVTPLSATTSQTTQTYSTPLRSGNNSSFDDKFTPLPSRKSRSGRKLVSARSTRRRTEIMANLDSPPKFNMRTDVDRRVLPTSPPLLNSPELESALFFSPSLSSANHGLDVSHSATREHSGLRVATHHEIDGRERGSPAPKGPVGARRSKNMLSNLQTAHVLDASPIRSRPLDRLLSPSPLRRSTAGTSSSSPTKRGYVAQTARHGRERSSTLPSVQVPMSPKERHDARCTALEKVDAIIERSWSARLLQDSVAPSTQSNEELQISNINVSGMKAVR